MFRGGSGGDDRTKVVKGAEDPLREGVVDSSAEVTQERGQVEPGNVHVANTHDLACILQHTSWT